MNHPQRLKISNENVKFTSLDQLIEWLKYYDSGDNI